MDDTEPGSAILSPPVESAAAVPLDSPIRTTPIHLKLMDVQVPEGPLERYFYNPITCQPINEQDVSSELEQLRQQYPNKEAALKAQEWIAMEAKKKIDEIEKKKEQVQKAVDKKLKERDTELKVLSKYQQVKAVDIPS
ncbi:hypothetical protein N7495_005852 [Penicillium taxi]|uniref:uncharacterized protein n=1 Tax=Penicillium taxi TaxID=168475 RepID=UPI002545B45F|nr:uncharacterized protein N7495_005852 [Penicillium taxi]KAJ5894161.1 hypothetical protein N7495_005852 [Penicillium taxi]